MSIAAFLMSSMSANVTKMSDIILKIKFLHRNERCFVVGETKRKQINRVLTNFENYTKIKLTTISQEVMECSVELVPVG